MSARDATMKLWTMGLAIAAALATLLFVFLHEHSVADGRENGVFANDCCGTLVLRNGKMVLNGKQIVRYSVGQDARGPYILPATYVGAFEDIGLEVDGTQLPARLRLDRLPRPTTILLYNGARPALFKRRP